MRKSTLRMLAVIDRLLLPFLYPAAWLLKIIRRRGLDKLPACRRALVRIGVLPVRNHFDEPRFDFRDAKEEAPRLLPGISWQPEEQLGLLRTLTFADETLNWPKGPAGEGQYHLENSFFTAGDAEFWYQMIRAQKPANIIEIGSGYSTLLAISALQKNAAEDEKYHCRHICIEPYRRPWLDSLPVELHRQRVETLDPEFFRILQAGDILFIDSSHIIRPDGDVLFEYLSLLPGLNKGVVVHVHDIHTPRDYPKKWLEEHIRLWNEQYLLEAFLTGNPSWKILAALNYLHLDHPEALRRVAPHLTDAHNPGSFYMEKVR